MMRNRVCCRQTSKLFSTFLRMETQLWKHIDSGGILRPVEFCTVQKKTMFSKQSVCRLVFILHWRTNNGLIVLWLYAELFRKHFFIYKAKFHQRRIPLVVEYHHSLRFFVTLITDKWHLDHTRGIGTIT